jgi:hypothetical protein
VGIASSWNLDKGVDPAQATCPDGTVPIAPIVAISQVLSFPDSPPNVVNYVDGFVLEEHAGTSYNNRIAAGRAVALRRIVAALARVPSQRGNQFAMRAYC